jgi:hypothetical protein
MDKGDGPLTDRLRRLRNRVVDIHNEMSALLLDAERPSEKFVIQDSQKVANNLCEKLHYAFIVSKP